MNNYPKIDRTIVSTKECDKADYGFVFSSELPKSRCRESNKKYYQGRKKKQA